MQQIDYSGRRNFLKYGAIGTGLVTAPKIVKQVASFFSPLEAEAAEASSDKNKVKINKVVSTTNSIELKLQEHDSIDIYKNIKRGTRQLESGISEEGYNKLRGTFRGIYETASGKFEATRNDAYIALRVMALAHAGFSSMNAASFVMIKERYLDNALVDYTTALKLRQELNARTKKPIERLYVEGDRNGILLVSEETLKERVAEILSELYKYKKGREREEFRREGMHLYTELLASAIDPNKIRIYHEGLKKLYAPQPIHR